MTCAGTLICSNMRPVFNFDTQGISKNRPNNPTNDVCDPFWSLEFGGTVYLPRKSWGLRVLGLPGVPKGAVSNFGGVKKIQFSHVFTPSSFSGKSSGTNCLNEINMNDLLVQIALDKVASHQTIFGLPENSTNKKQRSWGEGPTRSSRRVCVKNRKGWRMKVLQKWAKRACRSRAINIIDNYFPRDLLTDRETVYQEVSRCSPEKQGKENMLFDGRILFPRAKLLSCGLVIVGLDSIAFLCPQGMGRKSLRKLQHTPERNRPQPPCVWRRSFHIWILGYLGYVPEICYGIFLEKVLLFVC